MARLGVTGAAAALALAVFAPGALHPGDGARTLAIASASVAYRPARATSRAARRSPRRGPCAAPGTTDATPDGLARRLAVH